MATIKVVLRKKQNKDGTYPLAIRITENRKTSFIHLGKHIKETDWDAAKQRVRKSHPNSTRLNNFIISKEAEAIDKSLELESRKSNVVTAKIVKQKIKPASGGASFFSQAEVYLANLKTSGKYNIYVSEDARVNILREFISPKKELMKSISLFSIS